MVWKIHKSTTFLPLRSDGYSDDVLLHYQFWNPVLIILYYSCRPHKYSLYRSLNNPMPISISSSLFVTLKPLNLISFSFRNLLLNPDVYEWSGPDLGLNNSNGQWFYSKLITKSSTSKSTNYSTSLLLFIILAILLFIILAILLSIILAILLSIIPTILLSIISTKSMKNNIETILKLKHSEDHLDINQPHKLLDYQTEIEMYQELDQHYKLTLDF